MVNQQDIKFFHMAVKMTSAQTFKMSFIVNHNITTLPGRSHDIFC